VILGALDKDPQGDCDAIQPDRKVRLINDVRVHPSTGGVERRRCGR